ncbi:H/ACA RNA-protein complex component Gar1 [Haloferax sp. Atlit-12N]|uniref:H/ACA ribonucleoprotein complex subunit GAR1 n=1 Tax=Haloferax sp. Atlit-12N TaxID=2077203 RepID=UPI000E22D547|nr:Gar1/Naf1 family protein [Haloferax sp. Atlit-12N]RDZ65140.1 H/ACA RNA-protein complex component Gar1 [Haloferax sp. Atlit-12N]
MRRIGTVSRTAQGLAIVRLDDDDRPDIGTMVLDESLSTVGRIVDVFGPVDRPYVAVTADDGSPARLVGSKLYAR